MHDSRHRLAKGLKIKYPSLAKLALPLFASSATTERLFSFVGKVFRTPNRKHLPAADVSAVNNSHMPTSNVIRYWTLLNGDNDD